MIAPVFRESHYGQLIIDAIPSLVFLKDNQNNILKVNQAVVDSLGIPRERIEGKHSSEIFPDDADRFYEDDCAVMATGQPRLGYTEAVGDRWVRTDKMPIANDQGAYHRILVIATDITEVREAELERDKLQTILETTNRIANVGGWEYTLDPPAIKWSPQVCRIHGMPDDHQPSLDSAINYYAPDDRATVQAAVRRGIEQLEPWDFEAQLIRSDGTRVWVRAMGEPEVKNGKCVRLWGTLQDVTTLKAIQNERDAFFNATLDLLCVTNFDGEIVRINPAWTESLGYEVPLLEGRNLFDLVHPQDADETRRVIAELKNGVSVQGFTNRIRHRNDSYRTLEWSIPEPRHGDQVLFAAARDVTDQHKLMQQLQRSNAELDHFAYIASHDLKAPLRAIDHISGWLQEDLAGDLPAESERHLQQLNQRVRRMEKLLDDLLAYSRASRDRGQVSVVSISKVVRGVIDFLAVPKEFTIDSKIQIEQMTTRRTPLETVLRNLISNAVKHHDRESGTIQVCCQHCPDDDRFVQFSVADDGPGIAPELRQRAFKIFQTLRPRDEVEGSGVGLAIVQRIIETEGGAVSIDSNQPRGTVIQFTWPLEPIEQDHAG
ncbi:MULTISPECIES: PAS domain S-box protein [Crateriforma]|uniref:histidine kinase n=1 Tax=Crateriforma conspicua TaxID=2527996 RepID=A0A5C6FU01_9PLAN|nr:MULTISPECIES: PAS domain S-box protein [Crateriforma]TWU65764.1 Phytochrome-like protein cph1 [Crateriforma conspicua]